MPYIYIDGWHEEKHSGWSDWAFPVLFALLLHLVILWLMEGVSRPPLFSTSNFMQVSLVKVVPQLPKATAAHAAEAKPKVEQAKPRPRSTPKGVAKPEPVKAAVATNSSVKRKLEVKPEVVNEENGALESDEATESTRETAGNSEPDYTASYLNNPAPHYPKAARRRGIEGKVVLNVEVLVSGLCGQINVGESSGHGMLDEAALAAVKQWRFIPAHIAGIPVKRWFQVPIRFALYERDSG